MTYEVTVLRQGKNYSSCEKFKDYRKDLRKCITAAQNYIYTLIGMDIEKVVVCISSFGRKVYKWEYIPTMR